MRRRLDIVSTSNASDLGFLALSDLASAAARTDYRVVGGHMVALLGYAFPTPGATIRATTDADAGIARLAAAGGELHTALQLHGYQPVFGNQYVKSVGEGDLSIDVLVPRTTSDGTVILGGRGFDPIPGLSLALAIDPIQIETRVTLRGGAVREFVVPVPTVESAVVLKVLAWDKRMADKDLADIAALLDIAATFRAEIDWQLDQTPLRGERLDCARAAQRLLRLHRKLPARTRALLQSFIGQA